MAEYHECESRHSCDEVRDELDEARKEIASLTSELSEWRWGYRRSGIHPICSVCAAEIKRGINQQRTSTEE